MRGIVCIHTSLVSILDLLGVEQRGKLTMSAAVGGDACKGLLP